MKIQTFEVDNWKGCPVYFRNFGIHFEYLTIIEGQLYTASIGVKPHWITYILYLLGLEKNKYNRSQLKNILKQLKIMATTTVDYILENKDKAIAK